VLKRRSFPLLLFLFVFSLPRAAPASWLSDNFIDPKDGYLDSSRFLQSKTGFLPVPIIITEPAVGYGGGLALTFFHGNFTGDKIKTQSGQIRRVAPSVSAIAAGKTENGTWFAGGGHLGIWKQDSIRYMGAGGYASVNMDYYGNNGKLPQQRSVRFNSKALLFLQELKFRLWDSPLFAGIGYTYIDTKTSFNTPANEVLPGVPSKEFDIRSAAISLMLNYDSRDNIFTPSSGSDMEIKAGLYAKHWGGDDDFNKFTAYLKHYQPIGKKWVLGLRADVRAVNGDAPFYEYPFIEMRGIKMLRYQGEKTALGELELRWSMTPRWVLVGFAGAGKAFAQESKNNSSVIYSKGLGIRYLIASKLGLQSGIDIAKGPEDTAIYFQVGSSWLR